MDGSNLSRAAILAAVVASAMLAAGCIASPTYGTGKTANQQLADDVTGMLSLAPKSGERIDYKPRPELVKPASTAALPAPQESVAAASNPDWPESPEQVRARIRAEATANQDNPHYRSPLIADLSQDAPSSAPRKPIGVSEHAVEAGHLSAEQRGQREEFKRRLAENRQGSPTTRKYLSEPPLEYRVAAETAPADELGEDEYKKERRQKALARKKSSWSWRDLIPGL